MNHVKSRIRLAMGLVVTGLLVGVALGRTAVVTPTLAMPHVAAGQEQGAPTRVRPDHGVFDRLLARTVRDSRVDYLSIRDHHWDELNAYLDSLATFDLEDLDRAEGLALCINLYNATMIRAVAERLTTDYSPARDSWAVFDEPVVVLNSRHLSLNTLEHKIIRPRYREPRIHVALVCAAESCPPILARAYRAEDLEEVLEANLKRFVNDPMRNPIDRAGRKLRLSKLFEWYAEDFGGRQGVVETITRYLPFDPAGFELSHVAYSWKLNIAPPASGRWVSIPSDGAALVAEADGDKIVRQARSGEIFEVIAQQEEWLRVGLPMNRGEAWLAGHDARPYPAGTIND